MGGRRSSVGVSTCALLIRACAEAEAEVESESEPPDLELETIETTGVVALAGSCLAGCGLGGGWVGWTELRFRPNGASPRQK